RIRYFKKGTVHLKWKREDLLATFNTTAAAGRQWIGTTCHSDQDSQASSSQPDSNAPHSWPSPVPTCQICA
ncbi:MAG: DUF4942 domain-containing protein, partial [Nitrospira sp.]|nr:DUF4942 domain-containing protein [Nitrospira sp.]